MCRGNSPKKWLTQGLGSSPALGTRKTARAATWCAGKPTSGRKKRANESAGALGLTARLQHPVGACGFTTTGFVGLPRPLGAATGISSSDVDTWQGSTSSSAIGKTESVKGEIAADRNQTSVAYSSCLVIGAASQPIISLGATSFPLEVAQIHYNSNRFEVCFICAIAAGKGSAKHWQQRAGDRDERKQNNTMQDNRR
jgi:hypothetical protein